MEIKETTHMANTTRHGQHHSGKHVSNPTVMDNKVYSCTKIHGDNQGAIALSKNPVHRQRSKHIDVKYHFIRDALREGKIVIVYCPSEDMVADILTKPVTKTTTAGMQTSHLSAKFTVLKTKLTTCVIRGDPLRKHGVLVALANTISMERRAGREKAQHSVRRHDKRAHSRGTVTSVLVERMRMFVAAIGRVENCLSF